MSDSLLYTKENDFIGGIGRRKGEKLGYRGSYEVVFVIFVIAFHHGGSIIESFLDLEWIERLFYSSNEERDME